MKTSILSLFAAGAIAAYAPPDPWSTLTPDTVLGPTTSYGNTFGIQVVTLDNGTPVATQPPATQITDGQVQEATSTQEVVTQIDDGQIQQAATTDQAVTTDQVASQIDDGQVQAATTAQAATTDQVASQIDDGQVQAATTDQAATTAQVASQIDDGQVQATDSSDSQSQDGQTQNTNWGVSCRSDSALSMTLSDTVLTDSNGRIGSIVANRQFQFDGPPPQAGAIYAAGWSITDQGDLAIGGNTTFYQCLSGNFYNLYDQWIGDQCHEVNLHVVNFVDC